MQAVTTTKEEILPRSKPFSGTLGNSNKIIRNDGGHPFSQFASLFFCAEFKRTNFELFFKIRNESRNDSEEIGINKNARWDPGTYTSICGKSFYKIMLIIINIFLK